MLKKVFIIRKTRKDNDKAQPQFEMTGLAFKAYVEMLKKFFMSNIKLYI